MIFKVLFGDIKLKVGYYDLESLRAIAESNNIKFVSIHTNGFEDEEDIEEFKKENPLIY